MFEPERIMTCVDDIWATRVRGRVRRDVPAGMSELQMMYGSCCPIFVVWEEQSTPHACVYSVLMPRDDDHPVSIHSHTPHET